jgi:hypothetical protein
MKLLRRQLTSGADVRKYNVLNERPVVSHITIILLPGKVQRPDPHNPTVGL